jgi:hypothetical protein
MAADNIIVNGELETTVLDTQLNDIPVSFRPIKAIISPASPVASPVAVSTIAVGTTVKNTASTTSNPSGSGGYPASLLSVSAAQSPLAQQTYTNCLATITFTRDASDMNYDHVNIYFVGYHGNTNALLMASGPSSPIQFPCDATGESIVVYAVPVSPTGLSADYTFGAHTTLTLTGTVTAPPAPSVTQTLIGVPAGYQFSFAQLSLPANDEEVISAYRVYRNTAGSTFAGATLLRTFVHDPTKSGSIVVQDNVGGGQTYYYFVTAVNSAGLEGADTAAQSGSVGSGLVSLVTDVTATGSVPPQSSNAITYASTSSSIQWSWTSLAINRANGTSTGIANGSNINTTGLGSSTTYSFYSWYSEANVAIQYASSGSGSTGYAYTASQRTAQGVVAAQQMNAFGNVALSAGPMTAATTSSGSGGGSGGGSGTCPRSNMLVREATRGVIAVRELRIGDFILSQDGWTEVTALQELPHDVFINVRVNGRWLQVTPTHPFTGLDDTGERIPVIRASELTLSHMLFTVEGFDFVESIELVRAPGASKVQVTCSPSHVFYCGEDEPYILAHNYAPVLS